MPWKDFYQYVVTTKPRLDYLNDDIFKTFIALDDQDSIFLTKTMISLITQLPIQTIERQNIEFTRISLDSKTSRVDFLARLDNGQYINIEIEKNLAKKELLPKIHAYQSHIYLHSLQKGESSYSNSYPVYTIVLYDNFYIRDNHFITKYEFTCRHRESDPNNRLFLYLVEFPKLEKTLTSKSYNEMSKIEQIMFFIKYRNHPLYRDIIHSIEKNLGEVTSIMDKKYDMMTQDIGTYMYLVGQELDAMQDIDLYYQELQEEQIANLKEETEHICKIKTIIYMLENKFHQPLSKEIKDALYHATEGQVQTILEHIFALETSEEIKQYVSM